MDHKRTPVTAMVAITAVLFAAGCSGDDTAATTGEPSPSLRIAYLSTMTGPAAALGLEGLDGAKLAVEEINGEGGIAGATIELIEADDEGTAEAAMSEFQRLQGQGIEYFIGTMVSNVANSLGPVADHSGVLYIQSGSQSSESLHAQENDLLFGLNADNAAYGAAYHPWIVNELAPETLGVLAANSEFGLNEIKSLEESFSGDPNAPAIVLERFDEADPNVSTQLSTLKSRDVDALYVVSASPEAITSVFGQADELGLSATKLIVGGVMSDHFASDLGAVGEGAVGPVIWAPFYETPLGDRFVSGFADMYESRTPGLVEGHGYNSIHLLAQAIEKVGSFEDPAEVATALRNGTWESTGGEVAFDEKGRLINNISIAEVSDGQVRPIN